MRSTLVVSLLVTTALFGQSADTPLKLGDVVVTGTFRTRAYGWDWFEPSSGNNQYGYSGNLLRVNFIEHRKGWDWDAEFAAPFLLGLPNTATAPAPQGALGLGSNYKFNQNIFGEPRPYRQLQIIQTPIPGELLLMAPYLAWAGYAAYLTAGFWWLNPA